MADSEKERKRDQNGEMSKAGGKRRPRKRDQPVGKHSLIAALNHKLRRQLLRRLNASLAPLSPVKLSLQLDMPLSNISYHMDILRKCGAATVIDEKQVRGAMEHFYVSEVANNAAIKAMLEETRAEDEGKA